jgi:hypothetical protein
VVLIPIWGRKLSSAWPGLKSQAASITKHASKGRGAPLLIVALPPTDRLLGEEEEEEEDVGGGGYSYSQLAEAMDDDDDDQDSEGGGRDVSEDEEDATVQGGMEAVEDGGSLESDAEAASASDSEEYVFEDSEAEDMFGEADSGAIVLAAAAWLHMPRTLQKT